MGSPYPPADAARQRAEEILARPDYRPPDKSWLERGLDWLNETARSFLNSLLAGGAASIVSWIVLGALVAVVVVLVAKVSRTVQGAPVQRVEETAARRRSARDWEAEAEQREAAGEWKHAVRCRYRALVAELIARDLLRDVPGRTTGEFRVELHEHAPDVAVAAFADASDVFERAWYGDLPTGPDELARFRSSADEVLGSART